MKSGISPLRQHTTIGLNHSLQAISTRSHGISHAPLPVPVSECCVMLSPFFASCRHKSSTSSKRRARSAQCMEIQTVPRQTSENRSGKTGKRLIFWIQFSVRGADASSGVTGTCGAIGKRISQSERPTASCSNFTRRCSSFTSTTMSIPAPWTGKRLILTMPFS